VPAAETADGGAAPSAPRILFVLLHPGYVRYFRTTISRLAERGYRVDVSWVQPEKDPGDARLAEAIGREHANVRVGPAATRPRGDRWRSFAALVRSLADLSRYADPRYAGAPKLRARAAAKILDHVRTARIDPVTARLSLALVRYVGRRSSAVAARRLASVFRLVEEAIPTSPEIDAWLATNRPAAVLASPVIDIGSPLVDHLRSAAALGIPTGVCVASWDNLTGKGLIRVQPERVFVWNDAQRREAVEMHGIPAARVVTTGAPKFDEWLERAPSTTPAAFAAKVGLPDGPYLLYLCSSSFIAPDEVGFVREWVERLRSADDAHVRSCSVLVRPHPQNAGQWAEADFSGLGDVAIWPRSGAQPDAGDARADFFDSLAHSAAAVGVNTSGLIEAAIVGKSVLTVLDDRFAGTQEGTLHFHHLRAANGGFLHEARSWEEHLAQLAEVLARPDEAREQTQRFVRLFVRPHGFDRTATDVLADGIASLAEGPRPARRSPPVRARILRAALQIVVRTSDAARRLRPRRSGLGEGPREAAAP
jgi:hypothetical protein